MGQRPPMGWQRRPEALSVVGLRERWGRVSFRWKEEGPGPWSELCGRKKSLRNRVQEIAGTCQRFLAVLSGWMAGGLSAE